MLAFKNVYKIWSSIVNKYVIKTLYSATQLNLILSLSVQFSVLIIFLALAKFIYPFFTFPRRLFLNILEYLYIYILSTLTKFYLIHINDRK